MNEGKKPIISRHQEWAEKMKKVEISAKIDEKALELRNKKYIVDSLKNKLSGAINPKFENTNSENQDPEKSKIDDYIDTLTPKEAERLLEEKQDEYKELEKELKLLSEQI
ncbi:MAG: hypothetical protein QG644_3 [Patescibacteria group bacterium]|nr:hypothetical protein [Patescibacteria group bacterium]